MQSIIMSLIRIPRPNMRRQHYLIAGLVGLCVGVSLAVGGILLTGIDRGGRSTPPVQQNEPNKEEPVPEQKKEFIYGITLDRINELDTTIEALQRLPERPTTRIVFDEFIEPLVYKDAVERLSLASNLMGEILDSFYVKDYPLGHYKNRSEQYVSAFADKISIWEVGNEVNGEWLLNEGEPRSLVVEKIAAAHEIVKRNKGKSAITLYYNEDCWERPEHEMFRWIRNELPRDLKNGVDYAFISYYEKDCNNLQPDWQHVFERLRKEFPTAKLGFGEVGASENSPQAEKEAYLRKYYSIHPDVEGFVGGYFWWYFWSDMVEPLMHGNTHMINALADIME